MAQSPVVFTPQPGPQTWFLMAEDDEVLYGGAAFGGKSYALMADACRQVAHPRYRAVVFRREYPQTLELVSYAQALYGPQGAVGTNEGRDWRFPSGAQVLIRHLEYRDDWMKYAGTNTPYFGFDELTMFEQEQYESLLLWNRTPEPGLVCMMRATTNPWGPGVDWVKARFVDVARPGQQYRETTVIEDGTTVTLTRRFIPARYTDNPAGIAANPQYVARLYGISDLAKRAAYMAGDWEQTPGMFFGHLRRGVQTLPAAVVAERLAAGPVRRVRALDWGGNSPLCCLWLAKTPDGTGYVYREHYQADKPGEWHVDLIRTRTPETERIGVTVADPSMWARKSHWVLLTDQSIAERFGGLGLPLVPGQNSRALGYAALLDLLYQDASHPPRFFVSDDCVQTWQDLVSARRDPDNPDVVADDTRLHALAALRYGVMHLWGPSQARPAATTDPWTVRGTLARIQAQQRQRLVG